MGYPIRIREMKAEDCAVISCAFSEQGWDKPVSQYQGYLRESKSGSRVVLVAEVCDPEAGSLFAGYTTILWQSWYPPFREAGIPEISDFNVLMKYRWQGIGTALMDEAERRIREHSSIAGIGVGLTKDYGAAQILYVRRGYIPDGLGLSYREKFPEYGDMVRVDDDLILCLTKKLI